MHDYFRIFFRNVKETFTDPDYGLFVLIKKIFGCTIHFVASIISIIFFPVFYFVFNKKTKGLNKDET